MVQAIESKMNRNYENIKKKVGAFVEKNVFDESSSNNAFQILRPTTELTFREYLDVINNDLRKPKWQYNKLR